MDMEKDVKYIFQAMNILFHTYGKVCATAGGTERATVSIATALTRDHGCRCFSLYEVESDLQKESCFVEEFHYQVNANWSDNISRLRAILEQEKINVMIVQGSFIYVRYFAQAAFGLNCRVILAHHFRPGAEELFFTLRQHIKSRKECLTLRRKVSWLKNILFYPKYHKICVNTLKSSYREAYFAADNVVLLCHGFIDAFQRYGGFKDNRKFTIIPNPLSFEDFLSPYDIDKKKKIVLIVARMDETYKRISLALRIWKLLQDNQDTKDWELHIIGEGYSLNSYMDYVKRESIPGVKFLGRLNPIKNYKEASIFMMTSLSESWGLTLTEAQQYGVVPIAFNTYESLPEIISNNQNGIIVEEKDIHGYVRALHELITDDKRRYALACNAIESSRNFSQERICERWWNLLTGITNKT